MSMGHVFRYESQAIHYLTISSALVTVLCGIAVGGTLLEMDDTVNSFQTPSDYSASSSFDNYGANQASGSVFDSQGDDSPRAWCPRWPVQDECREWLQLDFDGLKVINLLITWGLSSRPDHFVPSFFLRYERGDGRWHDFVSHDGTKLIVANQNSMQPKTIPLSPPITAQRLRIIPYRKEYAQSMCLKLSVLGHAFNISLLSYEIPEGDVYQSPQGDLAWAALNDSSYDGIRLSSRDSSVDDQRHRLTDGLGVLVDRLIYSSGGIRRALEAPFSARKMHLATHQTLSGLVGWFCRSGVPLSLLSPPCQSRNVSLLFTFDSVRLFTELRIHVLNSFAENIAIFREAVVQFSVGGQQFDRYAPPVLYSHPRNISSPQPTWVVIPLPERVGRFVRIALVFDSDWIILSEVAFSSTLIMVDKKEDEEKNDQLSHSSLPVQQSPPKSVSTVNQSNHQVEAALSSYPQAQPPSLEDASELPLIISSVCVVGLVLVISVFVCVLCRSGSHSNRALLGKPTSDHRSTDGADCSGSASNGRKSKLSNNTNGLAGRVGGRILACGGATPANPFCLANTIAANDVHFPSKPTDMYSPFNGNDGMVQTLHLMRQHQQQVPTNDPNFQPLLQPTSGFGTLSAHCGTPHLAMASTTAASFFQAPPPPPPPPLLSDHPRPPFPPMTPASSICCDIHRPSSTVNPYVASSAVSIFANSGSAATAPMITSTHLDCSMAEYASASMISGQTGYAIPPPSIQGGTGGFIFAPQSTVYPSAQLPTREDVFLQPTAMLINPSLPSNAMAGNGVFPLIVSCSNGFGDCAVSSYSKNGLFDTLNSRGDAI